MFNQRHKGSSIPSWLAENSSVYVKRNVRHSNFDPLVDEVDVLRVNPHYAHIRFSDGRETTVSTKILAPRGETPSKSPESLVSEPESPSHASADPTQEHVTKVVEPASSSNAKEQSPVPLRRSQRERRPVNRLGP
eukprot:gene1931-biopygen10457